MSVIPMKLLTIAGPLEQFDPVAAACVLDREFHPENALALMERVSGLRPLSAADPYSAPLHRAEELLEAMDLSPAYAPFEDDPPRLDALPAYFDDLVRTPCRTGRAVYPAVRPSG